MENSEPGRKVNTEMMGNFVKACDWLESEAELHSVKEVQDKMRELSNGEEVYGVQYIKNLLVNRYQQHIGFCNEPGKKHCFL